MSTVLAATSGLFRDRDFFVHDGKQLRRFRMSASSQIILFAALLALVGWSSYAVARILTPAPAAIATTEAAPPPPITPPRSPSSPLKPSAGFNLSNNASMALAAALASENVDPPHSAASASIRRRPVTTAVGGPFDGNADPTFKQLFTSWKKLDNLASGAIAVPSDKPVKTAAFTSGYGVRSDPFRGGAAMHAGIDLAGPYGTPIYATADGTIRRSGWNSGGYGNLIEVDHGRGIETRYGHLSAILVRRASR